MSTWISKAILPLVLAGCVPVNTSGGLPGFGGSAAPQGAMVSNVALVGPAGFCPLPDTRTSVAGAGFMAFARCDSDGTGAVLTATVGGPGSAEGVTLTHAAMARYFASAEGSAALRGADSRDQIAVQSVVEYQGAVILSLTRGVQGQTLPAWRAFLRVGDQLVTLTVRARQGQALVADAANTRIRQFVAAVRGANGL
jgi:hypothetical protein